MRVVQFIGSKALGGAENFFARLCNTLSSEGVDQAALLAKGSSIKSSLSIETKSVPIFSVADPLSRLLVKKALADMRPDIVQTWMGRATRLTPRKRDYVQIARLGGYYNLDQYQYCDYWVGNTKGICDYMVRKGLPADRVLHISNFVEPQEFSRSESRRALVDELGILNDRRVMLTVGRLHTNKGFDTLIRAFAKLKSKCSAAADVQLVIAGAGPLELELKALAVELDINSQISWLGWRSDVSYLLSAADLFVCPSRHEPLGNVILEAWAQKVPVVTTASDGALELCGNSQAAVVTPIDDSEALAGALSKWATDDTPHYSEMAEAGYAQLQEFYSPSVIVKQYQELYAQAKRFKFN